MGQSFPCLGESFPQSGQWFPHVGEHLPQVGQSLPLVGERLPRFPMLLQRAGHGVRVLPQYSSVDEIPSIHTVAPGGTTYSLCPWGWRRSPQSKV